jgi:hypothetical protein
MTAAARLLLSDSEAQPAIVKPSVLWYEGEPSRLPQDVEEGTVAFVDGMPYAINRSTWYFIDDAIFVGETATERCDHICDAFAELIRAAADLKFSLYFVLAVDHPEVVRQLGEPLDPSQISQIRFYPTGSPNMLVVYPKNDDDFKFPLYVALPTTAGEVRKRMTDHTFDIASAAKKVVSECVVPDVLRFPKHVKKMYGCFTSTRAPS